MRISVRVASGESALEWDLESPVDVEGLKEAVATAVSLLENGELEDTAEAMKRILEGKG